MTDRSLSWYTNFTSIAIQQKYPTGYALGMKN